MIVVLNTVQDGNILNSQIVSMNGPHPDVGERRQPVLRNHPSGARNHIDPDDEATCGAASGRPARVGAHPPGWASVLSPERCRGRIMAVVVIVLDSRSGARNRGQPPDITEVSALGSSEMVSVDPSSNRSESPPVPRRTSSTVSNETRSIRVSAEPVRAHKKTPGYSGVFCLTRRARKREASRSDPEPIRRGRFGIGVDQ